MEQHIQRLSEAQRQLGVEVTNVFNRGQSSAPSAIQLMPNSNLGSLRPEALRNAVFYTAAAISRRVRLAARSGSGPLVVHAHGAWSDFLFARLLASLIGAKATVGTIHSSIDHQLTLPTHEISLRQLGGIFVTGRKEFNAVRSVVGDRAVHLPSAPAGLFFEGSAQPNPPEFDVVCVGKLVPVKRVDIVLDAACRLPSRRFAIAGDGPELPRLKEQTARLGIANVAFLGNQVPEQVRDLLLKSRLFLSTSVEEGTPTAMLEAMAVGLPVVMTPSNDYGWILERDANGIATAGWSVDEIVASIEGILEGQALELSSVLEFNRRRMQSMTWGANAARVTEVMRRCVDAAHVDAQS